MVRFKLTTVYKFSILIALLLIVALLKIGISDALSGSSFNAGRIMDDAVFYNGKAMSVSSIQNFLNAKVPTCDTWGTQPYGGTTRAAYSKSKGYPPPFTCLKSYKKDTPSKAAESGLCNNIAARSNSSAAQMIYDISVGCGVSPKVLLILLQKEQSLVTDDWPWPIQYKSATGFACPDTAPCSSTYAGFFNQVYYAARQYKYYRKSPDLFNFIAGETNFIQYNPNSSCGGKNVYIQNQATAGLYNYTPYTPNAAALNNLYGTGNSCSAYGNRNFWRMYIDWFGSTYSSKAYAWLWEGQEVYSDSGRTKSFTSTPTIAPNGKLYVRVKARNMGNKPWDNTVQIRIGTTSPNDRSSGFDDVTWVSPTRPAQLIESSVVPGEIGTFEFVMTAPPTAGSYKEYFSLVAENVTWLNNPGMYFNINVVAPVAARNSENIGLDPGESIVPGQQLLSPDTQSRFVLQHDGNLVLYSNFKAVWSSRTNGDNVDRLDMQSDGNLVLYNKSNVALWHSHTPGNSGAKLRLSTDGQAKVLSNSNVDLWETDSAQNPDNLSFVNLTIKNGNLFPLQSLETADRRYRLILQTDGNLVLYSPDRAIWSSRTAGKSISHLSVQKDGNVVLYSTAGKAVWYTHTFGNTDATLTIQADGNLVLYTPSGRPIWHTHTSGVE